VIQRAFVRTFKWIESTGSKPTIGGGVIVAVVASIGLSMWSSTGQPLVLCNGSGRLWGCAWDPGALYTNAIQNAIQLVILFATMGIAYAIKSEHVNSTANLHEKIAELRRIVESLADDEGG